MQALVLHAVGDARFESIPRPQVDADRVLVRIGFCGVCGSDIPRVFVKGTYSFPTVCGHEFAGVVEACGPDVTDLEPGTRVAVFPLLWCGRCLPCEQGKYVQCTDYDYLGSRSNGGFAEYVAAPRRNLLIVPENVSLEEAAMTEPAAVALHAVKQGGGCTPGETVVVLGAGPIGVMVAQWARAMGASRVMLFDLVAEKLELARQLGFSDVYNSREVDPVATVQAATEGQGAHLALDAAGVPPTLLQALEATRRGGRVVLLGNPSGDVTLPVPLISQLLRREIRISGTWNSTYSVHGDDDWRATLEAMSTGAINLRPLVTHRVSLEQSFEALRMMEQGREFFSKVLIHP